MGQELPQCPYGASHGMRHVSSSHNTTAYEYTSEWVP